MKQRPGNKIFSFRLGLFVSSLVLATKHFAKIEPLNMRHSSGIWLGSTFAFDLARKLEENEAAEEDNGVAAQPMASNLVAFDACLLKLHLATRKAYSFPPKQKGEAS